MSRASRLILSLSAFAILVSGCSKDTPTDSLSGTSWLPVHAVGEIESSNYSLKWDNDIADDGVLTVYYDFNGEQIEYSMTFYGICFFREKRENKYSRFSPATPNLLSTPLRYYIEDNKLYLETVSTSSTLSSDFDQTNKETKFVPSVLKEFSSDRIVFDGVTYKRFDK